MYKEEKEFEITVEKIREKDAKELNIMLSIMKRLGIDIQKKDKQ